jgi:hypothetical protein
VPACRRRLRREGGETPPVSEGMHQRDQKHTIGLHHASDFFQRRRDILHIHQDIVSHHLFELPILEREVSIRKLFASDRGLFANESDGDKTTSAPSAFRSSCGGALGCGQEPTSEAKVHLHHAFFEHAGTAGAERLIVFPPKQRLSQANLIKSLFRKRSSLCE